jgi:hypothetical protein
VDLTRPAGLVVAAAAVAAALAAGSPAQGATPSCGTRSVGPGTLVRGTGAGAPCLLAAYQHGCRAASYRLSMFGVDTSAVSDFRTAKHGGGCVVAVTSTTRVFPRPPNAPKTGTCASLKKSGTDVVAVRCRGGGLAPSLSLTGSG